MSCPCGHNTAGYEVARHVLRSLRMAPDAPGWWGVHRAVLSAHPEVHEVEIIELPAGIAWRVNRAVLELYGHPTSDALWLPLGGWRQEPSNVKQLALEG